MTERQHGKYRHHKYTWTKPFGSERHLWELVGPLGGVHFHVTITKEYDPSCGLEFHHTDACNYSPGTAPDHVDCWLTGGRCWHDGTSLYASEQVWPRVSAMLQGGNHDGIFRLLEMEADEHFEGYEIAQRFRQGATP